MKPDIVFFGEGLPNHFHECISRDKSQCDLLIVIGENSLLMIIILISDWLIQIILISDWLIQIILISDWLTQILLISDLLIGSSLKVRPVALIPSSLPSNVPQILINR